MKGLTDIPGILVGHASDYDGLTGCTVVLCEAGAVAGGDIRGSATGTEEWDVLNPMHVTDRIHGVCFAGRSAFGLEAAGGVRRFLEHKGVGFLYTARTFPSCRRRFCSISRSGNRMFVRLVKWAKRLQRRRLIRLWSKARWAREPAQRSGNFLGFGRR